MKYRDHKGSLEAAMETSRSISTPDELISHLNTSLEPFGQSVAEVKFEYAGMDDRIGWDTYYVLQRLEGETRFTVAGMSDGDMGKIERVLEY